MASATFQSISRVLICCNSPTCKVASAIRRWSSIQTRSRHGGTVISDAVDQESYCVIRRVLRIVCVAFTCQWKVTMWSTFRPKALTGVTPRKKQLVCTVLTETIKAALNIIFYIAKILRREFSVHLLDAFAFLRTKRMARKAVVLHRAASSLK